MIFNVPTKDEYKKIVDDYPLDEQSILSLDNFNFTLQPENSVENMYANNQIQTWHRHLANRIYQTKWSWVMLNYSFNQGIPDDEWCISPGRSGSSIEYFPHFEKDHHIRKAQFDYFSDIFYYKLFSAWDNLGHILNNMYELEINEPDFHRVVEKLKNVRPDLHSNLNGLIESDGFQKMKEFRHSSTHNELVGHVGSGMSKFSTSTASVTTFGVGSYIRSKEVKINANKSLKLFAEAVEFIKEQVQAE